MNREINEGALVQLRAYVAQGEFSINQRLPPERELCEQLGLARSELRKAFAVLESEGTIWRHVGKGTFVGSGHGEGSDLQSIASIAKRTTPQQVMHARIVLEPQLAAKPPCTPQPSTWNSCMKIVREHVWPNRGVSTKP